MGGGGSRVSLSNSNWSSRKWARHASFNCSFLFALEFLWTMSIWGLFNTTLQHRPQNDEGALLQTSPLLLLLLGVNEKHLTLLFILLAIDLPSFQPTVFSAFRALRTYSSEISRLFSKVDDALFQSKKGSSCRLPSGNFTPRTDCEGG